MAIEYNTGELGANGGPGVILSGRGAYEKASMSVAFFYYACIVDSALVGDARSQAAVDFQRQIRPIRQLLAVPRTCESSRGRPRLTPKTGSSLNALTGFQSFRESSESLYKSTSDPSEGRMPPLAAHKELTDEKGDIAPVDEEGAEWKQHWLLRSLPVPPSR